MVLDLWAHASAVGLQRKRNEDAVRIVPEHGLLLVADGMGGEPHGDIASRLATDAVMEAFEMNEAVPLVRAVESANREVWRYAQRMGASHRGMGCAFVGVHVLEDRVEVVWAGDCRAVCRTPRTQYDMTQDHATGHLLTRALGTHEEVALSLSSLSRRGRPAGDLLIALYSDGVWGQVHDPDLHALFDLALTRKISVDHVAKRAVALADRAGGVDNATIAIALV